MKKYLLFDLDGTLTDPKVGITTCVQYALQSLGIEEPDLDKLEHFIGPPLKEHFMESYDLTEEQAQAALDKYRERFRDIGIYENELYEGIPQMLYNLQSKGVFLAVASSKPTEFVERVLEHFNIRKYFKVVVGSEMDGTRVAKHEVIREALSQLFGQHPVRRENVLMIGDRHHDIEGARKMGLESVGVLYGYGSMEELKNARADFIVASVEELGRLLERGLGKAEHPKTGLTFRNTWLMVYPFLAYLIGSRVVSIFLNMLLVNVESSLPESVRRYLLIWDETGTITAFTGNASMIMSALGYIVALLFVGKNIRTILKETLDDMKADRLKAMPVLRYVLLACATVGGAVGLNLLLELTRVTSSSENYQQVVELQYSVSFPIGILCFGLIVPIAEELIFRGVIYGYLRRFIKRKAALILGAAFFGMYHMNSVQAVYALLMGCLIIYSYEYFGDIKIPILVHMVANIVVYSLTFLDVSASGFVSWPVCALFLVLAFVGVAGLHTRKKVF